MNVEILPTIWYVVLIFALVCYVILDGFDLGVGVLYLFSKGDKQRRILLNAIGPVWDGNEVWLVIVGGALFAGFPEAYATIFSAFYVLCMGLLCALIFRAVAIEFRSKLQSSKWRFIWDVVFSLTSIIISFCLGVVITNLVQGIAIIQGGLCISSFWSFLTPYPILGGITSLSFCGMHGSLYLLMKTEGALYKTVRKWAQKSVVFCIVCYVMSMCTTSILYPYIFEAMAWVLILPFIIFLCLISLLFLIKHQKEGWSFFVSCLSIALFLTFLATESYPTLVRSSVDPKKWSLTLFNTASSILTFKALFTIVIIGVPLILVYGFYIYHTFKGKVSLDSNSY